MARSKIRTVPLSDGRELVPGTLLQRQWKGRNMVVRVLENGFEYDGETYGSLSAVARAITGTKWNGFVFFGLKKRSGAMGRRNSHNDAPDLAVQSASGKRVAITAARAPAKDWKRVQHLDAQRLACKRYVASQAHEQGGHPRLLRRRWFFRGNTEHQPALLLDDVQAERCR